MGTDYLGMGTTPEGLEDITQLGKLDRALRAAMLSAQQARDILNDNAFRFIMKQLGRQ